jgi:hypothetical protein
LEEFAQHVGVVRADRDKRRAKTRWLTLAKTVGQGYDQSLEELGEAELQRKVEDGEQQQRNLRRNLALQERAEKDAG